jgi:monoterpene epsilon-lactone hydrolase
MKLMRQSGQIMMGGKDRCSWGGRLILAMSATITCVSMTSPTHAQVDSAGKIDSNGVVDIPAMTVPMSPLLTPEYKKSYFESLARLGHTAGPIDDWQQSAGDFKVKIVAGTIAGVPVETIEPASGIASQNRNRVLIDLHGSGVPTGWGTNSRAESVPMAALAGIKVIAINYREVPAAKFPIVSEQVAAVYAELLRSYRPENIGIYGCSAGSIFTSEALAWFQTHGLPKPGAAGLFCSGAIAGALGDSLYLGMAVTGRKIPPVPPPSRGLAILNPYFEGSDLHDPLASPAFSLPVLAKFPPTLLVSGTRDHGLSGVVFTHSQLVKAGVDAELHIWEGMRHAEFYNTRVPESKDTWDVIVSFFNKNLGNQPK